MGKKNFPHVLFRKKVGIIIPDPLKLGRSNIGRFSFANFLNGMYSLTPQQA